MVAQASKLEDGDLSQTKKNLSRSLLTTARVTAGDS